MRKQPFTLGAFALLAGAATYFGATMFVGASRADAQPAPEQRGGPDIGHMLVQGLQQTEGCLGVEVAQTRSGKSVIFAWFEDKEAVKRWYYSDVHKGVMRSVMPDHQPGPPLKGVPDDVGPIMAIASLTPNATPAIDGVAMPISQISIELYTPLTGGIFFNGRFAPDALVVPGMVDVGKE